MSTKKKKRLPRYKHLSIKEGDIVAVRGHEGRLWIALPVDKSDRINTTRTGLHLFGGLWYGDRSMCDVHDYGKILVLSMIPSKDIIKVTSVGAGSWSLKTIRDSI